MTNCETLQRLCKMWSVITLLQVILCSQAMTLQMTVIHSKSHSRLSCSSSSSSSDGCWPQQQQQRLILSFQAGLPPVDLSLLVLSGLPTHDIFVTLGCLSQGPHGDLVGSAFIIQVHDAASFQPSSFKFHSLSHSLFHAVPATH